MRPANGTLTLVIDYRDITIEVVEGDALQYPTDVLLLKYAQALYSESTVASASPRRIASASFAIPPP